MFCLVLTALRQRIAAVFTKREKQFATVIAHPRNGTSLAKA
jgi:hypothetical protein